MHTFCNKNLCILAETNLNDKQITVRAEHKQLVFSI